MKQSQLWVQFPEQGLKQIFDSVDVNRKYEYKSSKWENEYAKKKNYKSRVTTI